MLKVMIIDDSSSIRMLLAETLPMLVEEPIEVVESENALNALQVILKMKDELPDLIISDLRMPGMCGEELLGTLKPHPFFKDIPIVILSGLVDDETTARLKDLGVLTVIPKPPPSQSLIKVLNYIQRKS